jgi:hypothetical protein
MFLVGAALLVYGVVMRFFINPLLVHKPTVEDLFFLRPPPPRTGVPEYVPILAGLILVALAALVWHGK